MRVARLALLGLPVFISIAHSQKQQPIGVRLAIRAILNH